MLNSIDLGFELPIHRHRSTSETFVVLHERVIEEFYDYVVCYEAVEVSPSGPVYALNLPVST